MLQDKIVDIIGYLQEYVKDGEIADVDALYDALHGEVDNVVIYYNNVYKIIQDGDVYDLTEFEHCENLGQIAFEVLYDAILNDEDFIDIVTNLENLEA